MEAKNRVGELFTVYGEQVYRTPYTVHFSRRA